MILHHYTSSAAGDRLAIEPDGTFDVTFPATEGVEGFGGTERRIVALVHPIVKDDLRKNTVLNVTQAYLTTGIRDVNDNGNGTNSSTRQLVNSSTKNDNENVNVNGEIYDLSGRKVGVQRYGNSLSGRLPIKRGIYIVGHRKVVVPN